MRTARWMVSVSMANRALTGKDDTDDINVPPSSIYEHDNASHTVLHRAKQSARPLQCCCRQDEISEQEVEAIWPQWEIRRENLTSASHYSLPYVWIGVLVYHGIRAVGNAMRNGKALLMNKGYSEDEAITIMTTAGDFGITQVVDGNWGAHVTIPKFAIGEKAQSSYKSLVACGTSSKPSSAVRTSVSSMSIMAMLFVPLLTLWI